MSHKYEVLLKGVSIFPTGHTPQSKASSHIMHTDIEEKTITAIKIIKLANLLESFIYIITIILHLYTTI